MEKMVQIGRWMHKRAVYALIVGLLAACNTHQKPHERLVLAPAPKFNADSAYSYIRKQVSFGPRVPGTNAHSACGNYLVSILMQFGATVSQQKDSVLTYNGSKLPLHNIQASFGTQLPNRVLLATSWDSRAWADRSDTRTTQPSVGANDAASGVGILLEIARLVGKKHPAIGIDILLLDVENQDRPAFDIDPNQTAHFGNLGTKYWAENNQDYTATFAIHLNMVGAENATFTLEGNSMQFAPSYTHNIWSIGHALGFENYFRHNRTLHIQDAHAYIYEQTGIPSVNILHYDPNGLGPFWKHWHTHQDTMDAISKQTLSAVGQTLVQVLYNQNKE